jgi:hypothetical protein
VDDSTSFGDWVYGLAPGFWDGARNLLTGGYTAPSGTLGDSIAGGSGLGSSIVSGAASMSTALQTALANLLGGQQSQGAGIIAAVLQSLIWIGVIALLIILALKLL